MSQTAIQKFQQITDLFSTKHNYNRKLYAESVNRILKILTKMLRTGK